MSCIPTAVQHRIKMTLGLPNLSDPASQGGFVLWDRWAMNKVVSQRTFPYGMLSQIIIGEFDRIMRACSQVNPVDGNPMGPTAATTDLRNSFSATLQHALWRDTAGRWVAAVAKTRFPQTLRIHFDSRTSPWLYQVQGTPDESLVPVLAPPNNLGDLRAARLSECLAFVDRVSDNTINLGDNNAVGQGLSKIRIPGQINVNTASAGVLASIPIFNNPSNAKYVSAILAHRWRVNSMTDPRITSLPAKYQAPSPGYDFSNAALFPGYGIRSLAELEVPLSSDPTFTGGIGHHSRTVRDTLWADVYNQCTVRSDTFVLYGYIEAVKANPTSASGHNTAVPELVRQRRR